MLRRLDVCQVGEVQTVNGKKQVLLDVRAKLPDGTQKILRILVDTGAEANLIKKGLLDSKVMRTSQHPLALITADGSRMRGGSQEVTLRLCFHTDHPDRYGRRSWCTGATFHDADIHLDAILSCPWMVREELGLFPHLAALAKYDPTQGDPLTLLQSWKEPQKNNHQRGVTATCEPETGDLNIHAVQLDEPNVVDQEGGPDTDDIEVEKDELVVEIMNVRAMGLTLPVEGDPGEGEPLFDDEGALEVVASQLLRARTGTSTRSVITVPISGGEGEPGNPLDALRKTLTEGLIRDFEGSVLRNNVPPENLIPRGPHGWGHIELFPGARPKKCYPIRLEGERREALIELVKDWENQGKVEQGVSEWSSPAFVVAKKNGKWRGVVDFRALNEATVGDSHPLPRIEDILVRHGSRSIFTVMDLKDAFHQVPLHPASRHYTCTSTPIGTKQWCVVVMGLKNGAAIF